MTGRRQRRLDGLAAPDRATSVSPPAAPAAPAEPSTPLPTTPAKDSTSRPTRKRKSPSPTATSKERRAVSVPIALAEQLRARAQQLDRFHTDLVLDCLAATAADLKAEEHRQPDPGAEPFTRPRRHAHRGRTVTTLTLYLSQGEVDAIDTLARTTATTRSGLITTALDRHLSDLS